MSKCHFSGTIPACDGHPDTLRQQGTRYAYMRRAVKTGELVFKNNNLKVERRKGKCLQCHRKRGQEITHTEVPMTIDRHGHQK